MYWVISKDNFCGEGPGSDEHIVCVLFKRENADAIAKIMNDDNGDPNSARYYVAVPSGTKLQKFEP